MLVFTKTNASAYRDSLIREAEGLELLRHTLSESANQYLQIPSVISVNEDQLQIERIDATRPSAEQMKILGKGLAALHTVKQKQFGLNEDNYIGLNPQKNTLSNNWGEFFTEYRLGFQINLVRNTVVRKEFLSHLQKQHKTLIGFLNSYSDYASFVHGDLWSGNVLFDDKKVWLIDPAVYYGDREVDIAMTEMFGGFSIDFYQAYESECPLSKFYREKKIIYNLYHYLNHYNLFGDGYLSACHQGFECIGQL